MFQSKFDPTFKCYLSYQRAHPTSRNPSMEILGMSRNKTLPTIDFPSSELVYTFLESLFRFRKPLFFRGLENFSSAAEKPWREEILFYR